MSFEILYVVFLFVVVFVTNESFVTKATTNKKQNTKHNFGVICVPWSAQGSQHQWLDPKSLPTLVYVLIFRKAEIDLGLVECTPRLDIVAIRRMLPGITVEPVVFSTSDIGLPVARNRIYIKLSRDAPMRRVESNGFRLGVVSDYCVS